MSTLELQQMKEQLLVLDWESLQNFVSELLEAKKNNSKVICQKNLESIPFPEPTSEEAKIIAEFEANPELATKEEVLEMEKKLGIRLNYS